MLRYKLLPGLLLSLAPLLLAAAQEPSGQFSGSTTVIEVPVPVQVVKDGEPVRGLTQANFEIYEGRQRQRITGFQLVDLRDVKTATPSPKVLPPAARRHFLLLFDLTFSEPSSILKAREAAMKLVHDQMNPSDLVGVATYSLNRGPRIILSFTSDRQQVDEAIQKLRLPQLSPEPSDPLRLILEAIRPGKSLSSGGAISGARQNAVYQWLLEVHAAEQKATLQTEANEAVAFSQSLSDMAKALAAVRGRKYVVYLSEGFSGAALTGGKISRQTHEAIEQRKTWKVNDQEMYGSARVQDDIEKMLDTFRRSDCVIESVDIGGLRADQSTLNGRWASQRQRPNGDASLFLMANDTGGELFQHFNDLGAAMRQLLDRTSVIYLLSFAPQALKADGSYHRIRVKLINAPRGSRPVARPGFYAPKPYLAMNSKERRLANASLIIGGEENGTLPVSVLAAPFSLRAPSAKAYVPVLIEINGKMLLRGVKQPNAIAEIYVYALDPKGEIRDYRVQALRINVKQMGKAIGDSGVKFFSHLDLEPGSYSLRVLVRNPETGMVATRVSPLTVPAFGKERLVLLRPLFPEQPGKWVIVREAAKDRPAEKIPYPFMAGQQPFIPADAPELAATSAPLYVIGYHLPAKGFDLHAIVTRSDGTQVAGGKLNVTGSLEASNQQGVAVPATFSAKGLAPGHYQLRVQLKTASGMTESPPAPFVVGGS